jgi:hypothetical protein
MSGIQQALIMHGSTYRVTIGVSFSIAGYSNISSGMAFGSIEPSTGTFRGISIHRIDSVSNADFFVWLDGAAPQDYFKGVIVEDGGGVLRTYLSADAGYTGGAEPAWTWGTGSNRTWNTTDSGEVKSVSFF